MGKNDIAPAGACLPLNRRRTTTGRRRRLPSS